MRSVVDETSLCGTYLYYIHYALYITHVQGPRSPNNIATELFLTFGFLESAWWWLQDSSRNT